MTAQHLSKERKDAHLGIKNKTQVGAAADGAANLAENNENHELRSVTPNVLSEPNTLYSTLRPRISRSIAYNHLFMDEPQ